MISYGDEKQARFCFLMHSPGKMAVRPGKSCRSHAISKPSTKFIKLLFLLLSQMSSVFFSLSHGRNVPEISRLVGYSSGVLFFPLLLALFSFSRKRESGRRFHRSLRKAYPTLLLVRSVVFILHLLIGQHQKITVRRAE